MDGPDHFRLFIALPIPEAVKAELLRVQSELKAFTRGDGVKWVKPDQLHLTLRFLGQVETGRVTALMAATRAASAGVGPFPLLAAQAGFFPRDRQPRVLWAGLHDPSGALASLPGAIGQAVGAFAEKAEDRAFSPHLTLARIKHLAPAEARALAERVRSLSSRSFGEWTADRIEVMRSDLQPTGSRYTCLAEIGLIQA